MMQSIERSAGVLMAVSSLPSPYGIGTFGKEAYEFVDFLKESHHKYWQVLPLGPTTYGDSPYQSYSAFAGNPYLIDLDQLVSKGYLTKAYLLSVDWGDGLVPIQVSEEVAQSGQYEKKTEISLGNECYVSYEKLFQHRLEALHHAFLGYQEKALQNESMDNRSMQNESLGNRSMQNESLKLEAPNDGEVHNLQSKDTLEQQYQSEQQIQQNNGILQWSREIQQFKDENSHWLPDYAFYMALKEHFHYSAWSEWEDDIRTRTPQAVEQYRTLLKEEIDFWIFIQYEFDQQWMALKKYANDNGVQIIGDIPFYMGYDSADVWANSKNFQLNENLMSDQVAGVPPDAFSSLGQKWGNPLYDWTYLEAHDFRWWRNRMQQSAKLYDVIRIDHFIAVVQYYTIPANMPDARQGQYVKGPGKKLTDAINESIGDKKIIAEDLGVYVPEVQQLLHDNGYMGMKVLSFAFGGDRKNPHLPYNYSQNCVVYGGTHDNETLMGYFESRQDYELQYAYDYLDTRDKSRMVDQVFRAGYGSVADLVIFSTQDILKLENWARMNEPSSLGTNWKWRMKRDELTEEHKNNLRYLASVFGRE